MNACVHACVCVCVFLCIHWRVLEVPDCPERAHMHTIRHVWGVLPKRVGFANFRSQSGFSRQFREDWQRQKAGLKHTWGWLTHDRHSFPFVDLGSHILAHRVQGFVFALSCLHSTGGHGAVLCEVDGELWMSIGSTPAKRSSVECRPGLLGEGLFQPALSWQAMWAVSRRIGSGVADVKT